MGLNATEGWARRKVLFRDIVAMMRIYIQESAETEDSFAPQPSTHIHGKRHTNHGQIEPVQQDVLGQAVFNERRADKVDKVEVEADVDDGEDGLFKTVVYVVDVDPFWADLQAGRDPDDADRDVYNEQREEDAPAEAVNGGARNGEEGDAVDDDLHDAVDLEHPEDDCCSC